MTQSPSPSQTYTVFMHRDLVDALDYGFSPSDGIEAINNVFDELPKVHRSRTGKRPHSKTRKSLPLYRARFAWYPAFGFSYVQIGNELHVIELWDDNDWDNENRREVDCIVGTDAAAGDGP